MNANDLYQAALTADNGTATHVLPDGSTLYCSVKRVAGRSIVRGHHRTEWNHKPVNAPYSKTISRARAVELLKESP